MAKFHTSPWLQLVIIISFYFGFGLLTTLLDALIAPALTGYSLTSLPDGDTSDPNIIMAWKLFAVSDALFTYLVPALLFARWHSPRPIAWLQLDRPVRLWPALVVIVILLAAIPVAGFLYDWNATWPAAKQSAEFQAKANAYSRTIMDMPNFAYLPIGILLYSAIPAIARVCFFFGILQPTLIRIMPKVHWVWVAVLIMAVFFSFSYFQLKWFVPMVFIGLLLGAIYYLSGNLWLCILGMFIYISVDWVESYLFQRGLTNEDPLEPSATAWYTALVCSLIIIGLVWSIRKRIPKPVLVVQNDYQEDIDLIGK